MVISWLILATALICMTTMLLASMKEREKELAVLRALGAKAHIIILLIGTEALLLTIVGSWAGYLLITLGLLLGQPLLEQHFAMYISPYVHQPLCASGFCSAFLLYSCMCSYIIVFYPSSRSL
jgi:putative ABC transport system permease protein